MAQVSVKTPVIIETSRYRIVGTVAVPEDERLSDYVNDPDRTFFAITEATTAPLTEADRERPVSFILVNRDEVTVIMPGEQDNRRAGTVWDDEYREALGA
jgi:hypothetical protein